MNVNFVLSGVIGSRVKGEIIDNSNINKKRAD